jgi:putative FmdB family regulatory protein
MPIYEYACAACGHEFEEWQKMSDAPVRTCPKCKKKKVERLISKTAFQLKGGGWYADLYSSSKPAEGKGEAADKAESKPDSGKDSGKDGGSSGKESSAGSEGSSKGAGKTGDTVGASASTKKKSAKKAESRAA